MGLKYLQYCESVYACEGIALQEALKLARDLHLQNAIFEVDSLTLVQAINFNISNEFVRYPWFTDITKALNDQHNWSVIFARHEANCAADFLTRKARSEKITWNKLDAILRIPNLVQFI
ncbi:hypothetical protein QQ045_025981 [Rhodiola kirilowii]